MQLQMSLCRRCLANQKNYSVVILKKGPNDNISKRQQISEIESFVAENPGATEP